MTLQKNMIMSDTAAALTHTGVSGGLTIDSSGHVEVEFMFITAKWVSVLTLTSLPFQWCCVFLAP